jgi:hypothetical protein
MQIPINIQLGTMPHKGRVYHKLITLTTARNGSEDITFQVTEPVQNCKAVQLIQINITGVTAATTHAIDLEPADSPSKIFMDGETQSVFRSIATTFVGNRWVEQHEPGLIVSQKANRNTTFGVNNQLKLKALRDDTDTLLVYDKITLRFMISYVDIQDTLDSRDWRHGPQDLGADANSAFHLNSNRVFM